MLCLVGWGLRGGGVILISRGQMMYCLVVNIGILSLGGVGGGLTKVSCVCREGDPARGEHMVGGGLYSWSRDGGGVVCINNEVWVH